MNTAKHICSWMIASVVVMPAFNAHADTVNYTLDNVILADGEQITGTFDWTYTPGDFEGGSGVFTALDIPYTIYSYADGNLNINIQANSIEISGNGNFHDVGLDISLFLPQSLSPTQSASIDLGTSFFECCGNGFKDQPFQSGSISPDYVPGDANGDGHVDGNDYLIWTENFGNNPAADPPGAPANGDFNDDGIVDGLDYLLWGLNFGQGPNDATAVPEPGAWLLLVMGCVMLLSYQGRLSVWRRLSVKGV